MNLSRVGVDRVGSWRAQTWAIHQAVNDGKKKRKDRPAAVKEKTSSSIGM